jgi:hypothetical protein
MDWIESQLGRTERCCTTPCDCLWSHAPVSGGIRMDRS